MVGRFGAATAEQQVTGHEEGTTVARTTRTDDAAKLLEKIAAWPEEQRAVGERLHALVVAAVLELRPRLYYGQPGYARGGPVLVFFRNDDGLISFGLTEKANRSATDPLVESAWFVNALDAAAERRLTAVVRTAAG
ncbi:hypothetical protein [Blastococcus sp. VKM Ac-2987]|uniref:hypothetical protein n=1 Tax=Blastococcus sp. VKM Ac-2987 TaxID=3004141 RepID=UPI0022AB8F9D|nr:hypothetical protein [Blastococcus sp. VKM Ac-2987]MCZ2860565.1 hypothetical protein [Blastococcus sp. VKM Ac-2987]